MGRRSELSKLIHAQGRYSIKIKDNVYEVKKRRGVTSEQVKKYAQFNSFRKNSSIFTICSSASKTLREGLEFFLKVTYNPKLHSQLTKYFRSAFNDIPEGGEQTLVSALRSCPVLSPDTPILFSDHLNLDQVISNKEFIQLEKDAVRFENLRIAETISVPKNTTHLKFTGGRLFCNFENGFTKLSVGTSLILYNNSVRRNFHLELDQPGEWKGYFVDVLLIEFLVIIGGDKVPVMNHKKNLLVGLRSGFVD